MDNRHAALLRLLKPGAWYCASNYDGCMLLEPGTPALGKAFTKLVDDGFVESAPVFDGFSMKKYRITDLGSKWLASL